MKKELTSISKYYKSFSGTDTLVFILMPGSNPVVLGSLTTISYSMFRNKKPVINLGRTNINGVTRGSRIYAGTMIFTLINQHWLNELKEQEGMDWLNNYDEIKTDELPLFDLMIVSANEYGSYVSMFIYGVDLTDEAQVISVEDLFTENTFSFVARDISTFKAGTDVMKGSSKRKKTSGIVSTISSRVYVLDSSVSTEDDIALIEKEMFNTQIKNKIEAIRLQETPILIRDLEYSTSNMMSGSDVANLQALLNTTNLATLEINGLYDKTTEEAVRLYQSYAGLPITGTVNQRTYLSLLNQAEGTNGRSIGIVINRAGTYVYQWANMDSDVMDTMTYKEQIEIIDLVYKQTSTREADGGSATIGDVYSQLYYKTERGYVLADDVFSYKYCNKATEFPTINSGDESVYVTMLQSSLESIYGVFDHTTGLYDLGTESQVKKLQQENGLNIDGIVDHNTWMVLQNLTGDIINGFQDSDFKISFQNAPGVYTVTNANLDTAFMNGFNVDILSGKIINIKCTAICYYGKDIKYITKTYAIKDLTTILFSDFTNAFVYDPKYRGVADKIEYVVYPFGKEAYKWTINYTV